MEFCEDDISCRVDQPESMNTIAIHLPVASWYTQSAMVVHDQQCRFWTESVEIPKHVVIL